MKQNILEKFTIIVGWALWTGFYVLGIGAFLWVIDAITPFASWKPLNWSIGQWLVCIAGAIIGIVGYTLFMLMFVYLVRKYIHVGERKAITN